jgi:hypothetical protein
MTEFTSQIKNLKGVEMTLKVTVTREFRLRLWLGLALIKLGAKVTGMNVNVQKIDMDKLGSEI